MQNSRRDAAGKIPAEMIPANSDIFTADIPEPPSGIAERIILRIENERRRRTSEGAMVFGFLLASSTAGAVYGISRAAAEASHSGFSIFFSLLFSNFSTVIANFSDFALSAIETFPIFPVVLTLLAIAFAIWSASGFKNKLTALR